MLEEQTKPIERWNLIVAGVGAVLGLFTLGTTLWGVFVARDALRENTKLREMALREELYTNERWWYDRMAEFPFVYSLLIDPNPSLQGREYVETCINLASPGSTPLAVPRNMDELMKLLWDPSSFGNAGDEKDRAANLRRAFDTAEVMFYHMERIHAYNCEKIMDDADANTWVGLIHQVGPHPLLLAAAEDARRHGYVSAEYAQWFADSMSKHPRWNEVKDFYPELGKNPQQWVDQFRREEEKLRFLYPKGKSREN